MYQMYGGYPEHVTVRLHNAMMECRLQKVVVDEMHPDEFEYVSLNVEITDSRFDSSWMDKFHQNVGIKSLSKISQQDIERAWKMEREIRKTRQNPILASYYANIQPTV